MREIGHLADETQARVFRDFLFAQKIRNEIERETDGSWTVWVSNEEQVAEAGAALARFQSAPHAPEFRDVERAAAKVRRAEAEELAEYNRRIRTRRSLFPKFGGYGMGVLTFGLVFLCAIVAIYSKLGQDRDLLQALFITDPAVHGKGFLPEVFSGEVWRLFTPIFIHFGILHLGFNCIWILQLGSMIEARQGALRFLVLVAGIALISNLAQFIISHHPNFGGMSGVVYGLAGYIWMRGKYQQNSGLHLDSRSLTILMVWLVICFTGFVGPIANGAHLAGLIVGMVWGRISAYLASNKSD